MADAILARRGRRSRATRRLTPPAMPRSRRLLGPSRGDDRVVPRLRVPRPGYRGWVWEVDLARSARDSRDGVRGAPRPADDALLAPPWVPSRSACAPATSSRAWSCPSSPTTPGSSPVHGDGRRGRGRDRHLGVWPGPRTRAGPDDATTPPSAGTGLARAIRAVGVQATARARRAPSSSPSPGRCAGCSACAPTSGLPRTAEVVSLDHGCGAHSQTDVEKQNARWPAEAPVIDTMDVAPLDLGDADEPLP